MKKTIFTLSLLVITSIAAKAQQSVVATGGDASGSTGSVSYSVGQVGYTSASSSTGSVSAGVQQAYTVETVSVEEEDLSTLKVYPNPTAKFLQLELPDFNTGSYSYTVRDVLGKEIITEKITSAATRIDLSKHAPATYILTLEEEGQTIKTYRIIKN